MLRSKVVDYFALRILHRYCYHQVMDLDHLLVRYGLLYLAIEQAKRQERHLRIAANEVLDARYCLSSFLIFSMASLLYLMADAVLVLHCLLFASSSFAQ